jgi:sugar O-acyltransferase (sialic acid O-acetyltransferase NeuD family)
MKKYCILGQSNYAVAIILDSLAERETEPFSVDIVANIPPEDNDSLGFPYTISGISTREVYHTEWSPEGYDAYFVGSIGRSRQTIVDFFELHFGIAPPQYATLIHPSSVCSRTARLGSGVHISPLSAVAPYAILGNFTVINRNVSIGHHTILGDFVTFNPGSNVAGCCNIGAGVTIGAGATIVDNIRIGKGSIIGAGSVVTKDIPDNVMAYGIPAKIIKSLTINFLHKVSPSVFSLEKL